MEEHLAEYARQKDAEERKGHDTTGPLRHRARRAPPPAPPPPALPPVALPPAAPEGKDEKVYAPPPPPPLPPPAEPPGEADVPRAEIPWAARSPEFKRQYLEFLLSAPAAELAAATEPEVQRFIARDVLPDRLRELEAEVGRRVDEVRFAETHEQTL
jgi:hypothetical protein